MRQTVRVIAQETGFVHVAPFQGLGCGGCEVAQGCGVGGLFKRLTPKLDPLPVKTHCSYSTGDLIVLEIDDLAVLFAACILYLAPLLALVVVAVLLTTWNVGDGWVAATSLAGGGTALFAVRRVFLNEWFLARLMPRILDGD